MVIHTCSGLRWCYLRLTVMMINTCKIQMWEHIRLTVAMIHTCNLLKWWYLRLTVVVCHTCTLLKWWYLRLTIVVCHTCKLQEWGYLRLTVAVIHTLHLHCDQVFVFRIIAGISKPTENTWQDSNNATNTGLGMLPSVGTLQAERHTAKKMHDTNTRCPAYESDQYPFQK